MDHQSSYQSTKYRTNTVDIYNGNFNGAHGEDLVEITMLYRYFIDAGLDPRTATAPVEYKSKCATPETPQPPVPSTPATSALRNQVYEQRRVCSDSALLSKRGGSETIDDTFLLDIDTILLSGGSLVFSASDEVEDCNSSMHSFARDSICLTRERNKKNNKRPMIKAPSTQQRHPTGPSE
jgi:hypothetical protein